MKLFGIYLFVILFVFGCQNASTLAPVGSTYIHDKHSLGNYKDTYPNIAEVASEKTRIYIYRPQSFLGAAARPRVIVNGKWIGGTTDPPKTLLIPGSIFMIDSPTQQNSIWLQQGKSKEMEKPPLFSSEYGEDIYLRFSMKPTSSYLALVEKNTAMEEIQGLKFMGHFAFSKDLKSVCKLVPPNTKIDYVVISKENSAYTVFVSISEEKKNEVKDEYKDYRNIEIVPLESFLKNRGRYVGQHVIKDEYPNSHAIDGIVELILRFPETPVGLTWNGGVAITRNDYNFAEDTFYRFNSDSLNYKKAKNREHRADPVHPRVHLAPLLCW